MSERTTTKIPEGLENDDAFREYAAMSTEDRNTLKVSGPEVPDLAREFAAAERYDALKEVVGTQLELITDLRRQLENHKEVLRVACVAIQQVVEEEISSDEALRRITGALLKGAGIET